MLFDEIARRVSALAWDGIGEAAEPVPDIERKRVRIGLALGGGAARGWAHIGALRALEASGIVPDVIAGCSIGGVVGGCFAAGKLGELESFARSLTRRGVVRLLDFHATGSGLIGGDRLRRVLEHELGAARIEELPIRFATVATEFGTGHEIWLTRGRLSDALRASYALPGVFDPVLLDGRWLMDGALVNPVPVTLARAFGADLIICVNLNTEIRLRGTVIQSQPDGFTSTAPPSPEQAAEARSWRRFVLNQDGMPNRRARRSQGAPSMAAVVVDAFNITQDRISRSRLAGDPPDLTIAPRLSDIGLFEFHRGAECIELGRQAAERAIPDIREALALAGDRREAGTQAVVM